MKIKMNYQVTIVILMGLVTHVQADLYLHNPRGSNNRLNEKTATRANANRMFDSQNNNRGGYNVGDKTDQAAGNNANNQYQMSFFQSSPGANKATGEGVSHLTIEWTNQHGLGGNEDGDPAKQNSAMILQFMCEDATANIPPLPEQIRDGTSTQTIPYSKPNRMEETAQQALNRKNNNLKDQSRGLQESWESYDKCYMRSANLGLFIADQNVKKNNFNYRSATNTRQNPNGQRRGYECPEERDYFPYWHPTQWKDIAIMAENKTMCSHYQTKSFNVQPYHECVEFWPDGKRKHWSRWNNEADCTENEGQWILFHNYLEKAPAYTSKAACESRSGAVKYIWALPYDAPLTKTNLNQEMCLVALEAPDCPDVPWTRSNHLGNSRGGATAPTYTWALPHFPSGHEMKCVYRMRYNISTDDYDPYFTNASHNANRKLKKVSPVQDNIKIDVGGPVKLQMALNTDQTGRIFQDRSHIFRLIPRTPEMGRRRLFNMNVRGKRGNIVQVYPAVEYDFTPNRLEVTSEDLVHFQWTGSNTHNNGGGGGDGQAGDDGEGTGGTDKNNIAQIHDLNDNLPMPFEQTTMWNNAEIVWISHGKRDVSPKDLALHFSSSGYYNCFKKADCTDSQHSEYIVETKTKLQNQLNNAPASFKGAVLKFRKGTYHYMCTRNNNFTNRSQKGTLYVK